MKTSEAGLKLVKRWEGCKLTAYKCPAGVWTIGYGLTSAAGIVPVKQGMKITQKQADEYLVRSLKAYEDQVTKMLKRTPTQAQFDALVSLNYNIGPNAMGKSTVIRKFNAGDIQGAADAFLLFVKAGGKVLQGLVNRREDERKLFLSGTKAAPKKPEPKVTQKPDKEIIIAEPKPVYKHRRVWASIMGWIGGGGVASFGAFSGFDYRTMIVLVVAIFIFVFLFMLMYKKEIEKGLFSK